MKFQIAGFGQSGELVRAGFSDTGEFLLAMNQRNGCR
jgi:hypothetical protein